MSEVVVVIILLAVFAPFVCVATYFFPAWYRTNKAGVPISLARLTHLKFSEIPIESVVRSYVRLCTDLVQKDNANEVLDLLQLVHFCGGDINQVAEAWEVAPRRNEMSTFCRICNAAIIGIDDWHAYYDAVDAANRTLGRPVKAWTVWPDRSPSDCSELIAWIEHDNVSFDAYVFSGEIQKWIPIIEMPEARQTIIRKLILQKYGEPRRMMRFVESIGTQKRVRG